MSGTISFNNYPANNRVHGVFAEVDPQSSGSAPNFTTLILGQMFSNGTAAKNVPTLCTNPLQARMLAGRGSIAALMFEQYYAQDPFGTVSLCLQSDDPAGIAATGSIVFAGTATAAGVLSLYVAGFLVAYPVAVGTLATAVASGFAALINSMPDLPATATAASATLTLTSRNAGICGNDIDLRFNYLGAAGGQAFPAGITATVTGMAGGLQNPNTGLSNTIAAFGDTIYDVIVCPYTDPTSLSLLNAALNDTAGRWSWQSQLYGCYFVAYRGTAGALATFGTAQNAYQGNGMGFYDSPTPSWLWAADMAGAAAVSLRADPALPLQELTLNVLAPPPASRFPIGVRNTLLYDGIGTFTVSPSGQVTVDRSITFYQDDAGGAPDDTWLNTETPYSLVDITRDMRSFLIATYARKKLVADGTNIPGGSNMVTSQTILASALGRYMLYCNQGRAQNYPLFKAGAQAQNAGGGRVNLLLPFILPSQLRQIVMKVSFVANT